MKIRPVFDKGKKLELDHTICQQQSWPRTQVPRLLTSFYHTAEILQTPRPHAMQKHPQFPEQQSLLYKIRFISLKIKRLFFLLVLKPNFTYRKAESFPPISSAFNINGNIFPFWNSQIVLLLSPTPPPPPACSQHPLLHTLWLSWECGGEDDWFCFV